MSPQLEQEASLEMSVLENFHVAPSAPAPETASLPLTFFDVFWLNYPPVEHVFFYRLTSGTGGGDDIISILSNLRTSLSHALRAFYPLAGRLRLKPGTDDRYELHYQPGDGVPFAVAQYDADVNELAADEPREVTKILPLVPRLPVGGGAVLAVQATVLRGSRGLAVGLVLHHAACDGTSSTRFLHTWAASATGAGALLPPIVHRSLIQDPSGLYDVFVKDVASTNEMEYVKTADDKILATFTLSKEDIQHAKDIVVAARASEAAAPRPRCSSLVATFGFIWSCYQRAKDDSATNNVGGETYFIFPVDHRSRMKPDAIPDEYFGNCVGAAMHAAPKDRLAAAGASGLLAACTAVAAAIEKAVGDGGIGSPELWKEMIREGVASGGGVLTVAGSPRFCIYDVDFGFGRPAKVEIVSAARAGAMAVAESRRNSGGMEVGISLPPASLRRFQSCFRDAIACLHHH